MNPVFFVLIAFLTIVAVIIMVLVGVGTRTAGIVVLSILALAALWIIVAALRR